MDFRAVLQTDEYDFIRKNGVEGSAFAAGDC